MGVGGGVSGRKGGKDREREIEGEKREREEREIDREQKTERDEEAGTWAQWRKRGETDRWRQTAQERRRAEDRVRQRMEAEDGLLTRIKGLMEWAHEMRLAIPNSGTQWCIK